MRGHVEDAFAVSAAVDVPTAMRNFAFASLRRGAPANGTEQLAEKRDTYVNETSATPGSATMLPPAPAENLTSKSPKRPQGVHNDVQHESRPSLELLRGVKRDRSDSDSSGSEAGDANRVFAAGGSGRD